MQSSKNKYTMIPHIVSQRQPSASRIQEKAAQWLVFAIVAVSILCVPTDALGQSADRILLEKGSMRLELYRPGSSENYRGTRFDHSGMFHAISFQGKSLCQRWHTGSSNPDANDDVTGPCEEFGNSQPLGYEKGKPGSYFVKIGVGLMIQPDEKEYKFMTPYKFAKRGTWDTTATSGSVRFEQTLVHNGPSPIGYRYSKTIEVQNDGFTIHHALTNLGAEELVTDHYNHNFFLLEGELVGSDYEVELNYMIDPQQIKSSFDELVTVDGKTLRMKDKILNQSYFARLDGHQNKVEDHRFVLRNRKTGLEIECTGDRELHKFNFWGLQNTICPEPYVFLTIPKHETKEWSLSYRVSQK
jgi:hypothetical protein